MCYVFQWGCTSSYLRVVHAGHLSDLVHKTHAEELQHCGYKRVLEKASVMVCNGYKGLIGAADGDV